MTALLAASEVTVLTEAFAVGWPNAPTGCCDRPSRPGDGVFLAGSDVKPGTYKSTGNSGCYWARLSDTTGSAIIDSFVGDGQTIVRIKSTDKAFETSGCSEFHRVG